ncbi:MAG: hypothetical protein R3B72_00860 [Polyangiaceae bacterium]
MSNRTSRLGRALAIASCLAVMVTAFGDEGEAKHKPKIDSRGDTTRGRIDIPLHRGTVVPPELLSFPTLQNCTATAQLTITWDKDENWVNLKVKGKKVLIPNPVVDRTEGVDYFTNPFWPEPEDIQGGRYQLWIIGQSELVTYYYDAITLDLLGSEYDFPQPPNQPFIPLHLPGARIVPTDFIYPDQHGNVDFEQTWDYDNITRGDLPNYTHSIASFIPHNLCLANPFRYDLTTARPYATPARPASEAMGWDYYLKAGMLFDLTLEPSQYFMFPPISTNVGVIGNATAIAGGIPPGWGVNWDAIFGNVAPPLSEFGGRNSCTPYLGPPHIANFNQCGPPMP